MFSRNSAVSLRSSDARSSFPSISSLEPTPVTPSTTSVSSHNVETQNDETSDQFVGQETITQLVPDQVRSKTWDSKSVGAKTFWLYSYSIYTIHITLIRLVIRRMTYLNLSCSGTNFVFISFSVPPSTPKILFNEITLGQRLTDYNNRFILISEWIYQFKHTYIMCERVIWNSSVGSNLIISYDPWSFNCNDISKVWKYIIILKTFSGSQS